MFGNFKMEDWNSIFDANVPSCGHGKGCFNRRIAKIQAKEPLRVVAEDVFSLWVVQYTNTHCTQKQSTLMQQVQDKFQVLQQYKSLKCYHCFKFLLHIKIISLAWIFSSCVGKSTTKIKIQGSISKWNNKFGSKNVIFFLDVTIPDSKEFKSLEGFVSEKTLDAIADMGFTTMMEIQHQSIVPLLQGRWGIQLLLC